MRHKEVIGMYDSLLKQIHLKIGKKVDIYDPYGSDNIVVRDYEVTQRMVDICIRRKNYWIGR
tara:strand:- start:80 stop:265 length:186 start_codon:yes stop_codon:yes gene_type:complete